MHSLVNSYAIRNYLRLTKVYKLTIIHIMSKKIISIHPGEILKEEFLDPFSISAYKLGKDTGITKASLSRILNRKQSITPEVDIVLSSYFGLSEGYFLKLQYRFDLLATKQKLSKKEWLKRSKSLHKQGIKAMQQGTTLSSV